MKKSIYMIIFTLIFLYVNILFSQTLIFYDDFESGTNDGWLVHPGSTVSTENPKNGDYSMMINDNNQTNLGEVIKSFNRTEIGIVKFWFYYDGGDGGVTILPNDGAGSQWHPSFRFTFWVQPSGRLVWRESVNSSYVDLPVPTNVGIKNWNLLEFWWDSNADECEVYVNNQSKGIIKTKDRPGKVISEIRFQGGRTPYKDKAFFDDIEIYSGWPPETVEATIDLDPNVLNLKSKGKWITAYIELPGNYDVNDIAISIVKICKLDGDPVEILAEAAPTEVGDNDNDGEVDLMVKFDRTQIINALNGKTGAIEFTVSGKANDINFEGTDDIEVKNRGLKKNAANDLFSARSDEHKLFHNYPNPFNPSTNIYFQIAEPTNVSIKIFNALGQQIRNLTNEIYQTGSHEIKWDGKDLNGSIVPTGLYFAQIKAGNKMQTIKMMFAK